MEIQDGDRKLNAEQTVTNWIDEIGKRLGEINAVSKYKAYYNTQNVSHLIIFSPIGKFLGDVLKRIENGEPEYAITSLLYQCETELYTGIKNQLAEIIYVIAGYYQPITEKQFQDLMALLMDGLGKKENLLWHRHYCERVMINLFEFINSKTTNVIIADEVDGEDLLRLNEMACDFTMGYATLSEVLSMANSHLWQRQNVDTEYKRFLMHVVGTIEGLLTAQHE